MEDVSILPAPVNHHGCRSFCSNLQAGGVACYASPELLVCLPMCALRLIIRQLMVSFGCGWGRRLARLSRLPDVVQHLVERLDLHELAALDRLDLAAPSAAGLGRLAPQPHQERAVERGVHLTPARSCRTRPNPIRSDYPWQPSSTTN